MAALVLSVAGAAVGGAVFGPAGAIAGRIVGAIGGNLIDRTLFAPHTDRNVEGIATAATPDLIGPPAPAPVNAANNSIGDRPSTALPVVPPDPLLPGQRIYRWTTLQVDFRNLGVGVAL